MRDWADVLPPKVAEAQHRYERHAAALRMRKVGLTYDAIGSRIGVTRERARQIVFKMQRMEAKHPMFASPVSRWLENRGIFQFCGSYEVKPDQDLAVLAGKIPPRKTIKTKSKRQKYVRNGIHLQGYCNPLDYVNSKKSLHDMQRDLEENIETVMAARSCGRADALAFLRRPWNE